MLLRFSAANHLSIRDKQELSLVASSLKDREEGLIACDAVPGKRVLPAAVIYGANASGKTNLLNALGFMRHAVVSSHSRLEPGEPIPRSPFGLDPACAGQPSVFEIDFIAAGARYHYGFEALDDAFQSEWLYAFPSNRRQILFERKTGEPIAFGRGLKGRNRVIEELTRPNSLFLSAAAQNNHEQLSPVVGCFQDIEIESAGPISERALSAHLTDDEVTNKVTALLSRLGTGVTGFRRRKHSVVGEVAEAFANFLKRKRLSIENETNAPRPQIVVSNPHALFDEHAREHQDSRDLWTRTVIEFTHRDSDGNMIFFDLSRESAGTRRLGGVIYRIYGALNKGTLIVIDELDASLHTQASEAVLALVSNAASNPKGAQLITTTHDTNLLRSALLRRDQIWFTEKDEGGATHLYPLSDFTTRKGDNIEKGYLQGRFGAIPFAGSVADLFADG